MLKLRYRTIKRIWVVSGGLLIAVVILTVPLMDLLAHLSSDPNACSGYSLHQGCTVDDSGGNLVVHAVMLLIFVFIATSIYMMVSWIRNKNR